ncbi:TPM domain-containing protein [Parafrigoribacterium mesophilum]|uniref:TPM domain-containing protein n=1 Tax=Parafrigoribacterium mesophilum TaxID=433646 RepID=UPI0031FC8732
MQRSKLMPWAAAALGAAIALGAPAAAIAEPPVDLGGAYVVDAAGAVEGQQAEITDALNRLTADTNVQLFVVYVDSFDGVSPGQSWADATAELNDLGNGDVLLAVAVEDRNYQLSYPNGFKLSETETREIESKLIEPRLRANDWAGAAIAAADGLREKITAPGFPWVWVILGVIVIVALALLIRSRVRRSRSVAAQKLSQKQLDQRAGILLVQLDDEIRTSEQELGFAVAQFGDEAAKPFVAALAEAKEKARTAFELRQKLDDAFPESADERRAMTLKIVELAEAADAELDAQADAFDDLRALEKTAPEQLVTVRAAAGNASSRLADATRTLASLEQEYSAAAAAPVAGNSKQASDLLAFVTTSASEADQALDAGQAGRAAVAVRAAQAAVGQVTQLLDAVDRVAADLGKAHAALGTVVSDTEQDLAAARALPEGDPRLASAIAAAEAAVTAAAAGDNPIAGLTTLQKANAQLDAALASVREEQEKVRRASAALDQAIFNARAEISAAHDFITTRRGGIGDTARTRLSEAMRHLDGAVAVATSDPVTSLSQARAAANLAQNALASAQDDLQQYSIPGLGGMGGGYGRGNIGADIGGAILGGIIGGMLSGGGRGGGMFGGGRRGGGMFGGGGGFGGGGFSGGGFGGGSRGVSGGRRSSGGRF